MNVNGEVTSLDTCKDGSLILLGNTKGELNIIENNGDFKLRNKKVLKVGGEDVNNVLIGANKDMIITCCADQRNIGFWAGPEHGLDLDIELVKKKLKGANLVTGIDL